METTATSLPHTFQLLYKQFVETMGTRRVKCSSAPSNKNIIFFFLLLRHRHNIVDTTLGNYIRKKSVLNYAPQHVSPIKTHKK